jgi:hypothetical protein
MTARDTTAQLGLFGDPVPAAVTVVPLVESNDVDLLLTVAGNGIRCGYLLVGTNERVYAYDGDSRDDVVRVPRFEEDAVHQLLRRRWFSRGGGTHHVTCGAASLTATAVLVPTHTRSRVDRWQHLQRPPSWPTTTPPGPGGPAAPIPGRVIRLDDRRRR